MMKYGSAFLVLALALCACSSAAEDAGGSMAPQPIVAGAASGPMSTEKGDVNSDGKPDVWNYFKTVPDPADPTGSRNVLVKKEADLDFDGRKDITRLFDDEGTLVEEEADLDFDGKRDQVNVYQKGVLAEKRIYRSGKDHVFIQKLIKDGKMTQMNRDDNDDGRFDYCEVWYQGEKLSKRGWDKDNDGECDYWENAE